MSKFDGIIDPWKLIYRRLRKIDFDQESISNDIWLPDPRAFQPPAQRLNDGLSVFEVNRTTPYRVLNHHLDVQYDLLENGSEEEKVRAKRLLDRDQSVEHMLDLGWRVVVVPKICFPNSVFARTHGVENRSITDTLATSPGMTSL